MAAAEESGLLPTTIEKDHALGWMLFGIAQHPVLGQWIFKGGMCLKKCWFDTYRFSEDLDFTLPEDMTTEAIDNALQAVTRWVSNAAGLEIPEDGVDVEPSVNKLGQVTHHAKVIFRGPLALPRQSRQRIKFDLTHHELVGVAPIRRQVFHPYSDRPHPAALVCCNALEEILAEKTRALVQRAGRARDVYDVVNIGRNFRDLVDVGRTRELAEKKFEYKGLPSPTPEGISRPSNAMSSPPTGRTRSGIRSSSCRRSTSFFWSSARCCDGCCCLSTPSRFLRVSRRRRKKGGCLWRYSPQLLGSREFGRSGQAPLLLLLDRRWA